MNMLPNKFLLILIVFVTLGIFACTKSNDPIPDGQGIILNDSSATTGSLVVFVYVDNNTKIVDAKVSLYLTFQDLENDLPILTIYTDNQAAAYFGFLNYGNYYIKASKLIDNVLYENIAVAQVQAQKELATSIFLFK